MTQRNEKMKNAIIITGIIVIVSIFTNISATITSSVNTTNGTSCVVSAFAG